MSATVNKNERMREDNFHIYYDNCQSADNFNENIAEAEYEDGYTYLYVDYGNLSNEVDYSIYPRQKGKIIKCLLAEFSEDFDRKELLSLPQDVLNEWLEGACYDKEELLQQFETYNIKNARTSDYIEIVVTGYSQGERATVLVNKKEALKIWGSEDIDEKALQTELEHYFYDSPLNVRIDILGTEYICETFDGQYQEYGSDTNYDKDKLIKELLEYFKDEIEDLEFFEEQLEDYIPSEPIYR